MQLRISSIIRETAADTRHGAKMDDANSVHIQELVRLRIRQRGSFTLSPFRTWHILQEAADAKSIVRISQLSHVPMASSLFACVLRRTSSMGVVLHKVD